VNFFLIVPYYLPSARLSSEDHGKSIKMVLINVNSSNTNYSAVSRYIEKMSPDILALEEINERWLKELRPVLKNYSLIQEIPREDNFGIGLYSRIPMDEGKVIIFSEANVPSITANFVWQGQLVSLLFTHPVPPGSPRYYAWRNEQLQNMAFMREQFGENFILLGDLNTTSWSSYFKTLIRDMKLKDTRKGFGLQPSWPAQMPVLGIAIDHCLVSEKFKVIDRRVGPNIGSDHYPVFVELSL